MIAREVKKKHFAKINTEKLPEIHFMLLQKKDGKNVNIVILRKMFLFSIYPREKILFVLSSKKEMKN